MLTRIVSEQPCYDHHVQQTESAGRPKPSNTYFDIYYAKLVDCSESLRFEYNNRQVVARWYLPHLPSNALDMPLNVLVKINLREKIKLIAVVGACVVVVVVVV